METARCKAFLRAVDMGSMTSAAESLGYTTAAVSQLVASLESELGMKLLDRSRRGVTLTHAGAEMLPVIRQLVSDESALYERASEIKGLLAGTVTIASYPSMATYWLPAVIQNFRADYPNIEIHLMEGIRQEIIEWISDGTADMGFLSDIGEMDCDWIRLAGDRMVAVLPRSHPLADAERYPVKRYLKEDFIMPALGRDVDLEAVLKRNHVQPQIRFSTMEAPAVFALIESGLGVSLANELCTTMWSERLAVLPLDPPEFITYGIGTPHNHYLSPAAEKFKEYAVRMLSTQDRKK